MDGGVGAGVPVAVGDAFGEDDEGAGTGFVFLAFDLNTHGAAEDVEGLVDGVGVETGRGAAAGGGLDAVDGAGGAAGVVVEEGLGEAIDRKSTRLNSSHGYIS